MKKVAFDCKGTLMNRPADHKVVKLFKWFESKGCEMYIWSSLYSYAKETRTEHGFDCEIREKFSNTKFKFEDDMPLDDYMDIAVDDDCNSDYLAAHEFIFVSDIPEDSNQFEAKFGHLLK